MLKGVDAEEDNVWVFEELWKIRVPTKITIFAWRLLKERLQTKTNLRRRRVAINDTLCPFCGNSEENEAHVFLTCDRILSLWWESMTWSTFMELFRRNRGSTFPSTRSICLVEFVLTGGEVGGWPSHGQCGSTGIESSSQMKLLMVTS